MAPSSSSSTPAFSRKQRALIAVLPPLAATLIRLLGSTLQFDERLAPQAHPADRDQRPDLYPFWHRCLLLAAYRYRDLGIRILISQSFDGELIARTVARLGFVPVRGSSSRGGSAGLLQLSRALAAGHKCAITADGPRGPAYAAKPGAAAVARNAASRRRQTEPVSISAFYLSPHNAWTLRSWDRFLIPKPFSRVSVAWATPLIAEAADPDSVQTALEAVTALAEAPPDLLTR